MKSSVRYWKYFQTIGSSPRVMRRSLSRWVCVTMFWSYSSSSSVGSSRQVEELCGERMVETDGCCSRPGLRAPRCAGARRDPRSARRRTTTSSHWLSTSLRANGTGGRLFAPVLATVPSSALSPSRTSGGGSPPRSAAPSRCRRRLEVLEVVVAVDVDEVELAVLASSSPAS